MNIEKRHLLKAGAAICFQSMASSILLTNSAAAREAPLRESVTDFSGDLKNPPELHAIDGLLDIIVDVEYSGFDLPQGNAWLRSYSGNMPGATWRVKPGDTMRVLLRNHLPANPNMDQQHSSQHSHGANEPHISPNMPNTTNLHYHGLHVDPKGDSDNVFLEIHPGQQQQYVVDVPSTHPVGTYWYHPHRHGSVALQIASGMAGMLIMDNPNGSSPYVERHLVVQSPEVGPDGVLEDPEQFMDLLSENYFTINGEYRPKIHLEQNVPQYWRLLHANDCLLYTSDAADD